MSRIVSPPGSYALEQLERAEDEAARLAIRAQLRLTDFPDLLRRHGFPDEGRVLEVGCGQGLRTRVMAGLSGRLDVIGIDRSREFIDAARWASEGGPPNLSYLQADLHHPPFGENTFDFIYARLVFMHVPDPVQALRRLLISLKPGGRMLIEDAARDCMFFEPAPDTFAEYWRAVQDGQRRRGGDPNVGRRLAPYLKAAGFQEVDIEVQPIVGDGEEIGFMVRELLPTLNEYLEPALQTKGEAALRDLAQLAQDPHAAFFHFWFAVSGEKSPSEIDEA